MVRLRWKDSEKVPNAKDGAIRRPQHIPPNSKFIGASDPEGFGVNYAGVVNAQLSRFFDLICDQDWLLVGPNGREMPLDLLENGRREIDACIGILVEAEELEVLTTIAKKRHILGVARAATTLLNDA